MTPRELEDRALKFSERCLALADALPAKPSSRTLAGQLARCAQSVAANYRAACRARSRAEFLSKLSIVVEEADEAEFCLTQIMNAKLIRAARLNPLREEAGELLAIFAKSRATARSRASNAESNRQIVNRKSSNRQITVTGIGYDVHRFIEGRPLILGGVEIAHTHGLDGHSDADVLTHAIADAVLGAIGERDIGFHFPNDDQTLRGMSSLEILRKAAALVGQQGGRVLNIDATLIAEAPKIGPHVAAMRVNLAAALGLDARRVGVKATTNEGMGFLGRGEGIAALAVASVDLPE